LLKYELIEPMCSKCGNTGTWNGNPLVLQLDHIDGNSRNNLTNNLRLLCPNCHSQTKTYCRSSNSNNRANYDELEKIVKEHNPKTMNELLTLLGISSAKLNYQTVNKKLIEKNIKTKFKHRCLNCDDPIRGDGKTGYCNKCSHIVQHRCEHPSKPELIELIKSQSLLQIGKLYGVSDNAVRKWLQSHNLPYRKKDIQEYIEISSP
jgi:Zn finger protein HypA/HybF involved in hydrogenase expression